MVGKSFPLRIASVHKRARSFALSCDIVKINAQILGAQLIQINATDRRSTDPDKSWTGMTIFGNKPVMYLQLAEKTGDTFIKQELRDLAAVCEEVANNIEDRRLGG